jgi:crotonobetainyl-CoA:carnitine CoA-transferase CaiB-like acyl-CoA transferase
MRTLSARPPTDPSWLEWSAIYHACNGSKRAISVDLDHDEGLDVARQVIASCDGVIENFSPRVMDRFGLDRLGVGRIRPNSVYVRMPAFGLDNAWRDRPAFQQTIEPIAGIAGISGYPDRGPQPIMICDGLGGVHAAFGMLCGLHHRDRSGQGVHVEVRLSEVAAAIAAEQVVTASARGETMQRIGNRHRWTGPQGVFKCGDGSSQDRSNEWVAISVDTDDQWRSLCSVVETCKKLADATAAERQSSNADIERRLALWCASVKRDQVVAHLVSAGVPVAELSDGQDLLHNPQLVARGYFGPCVHPICGPIKYPGLPFNVALEDGTELVTSHRSHAPVWGQHDDQLKEWIQIDEEHLESLKAQGVIGRGVARLGPM